MSAGVDLHAHTTASDGTLSPRELVRLAVRHGVRVLAVTDHDSTEGLGEALAEAALHPPLEIVPGLEINCDVDGGEVHVLGYFVDTGAAWFQEFLRVQREERVARVHRMAARLAELGMPIEPAEVFAIDKYLRAGGPANVPRTRLTPVEAVQIIRRARGVPVLAHPGLAGKDELIPELVGAGLLGIETYYSEHSAEQTRAYAELCARLGLVATGGSDYHGPQSGRANPPGTPRVPMAVYERLKAQAA